MPRLHIEKHRKISLLDRYVGKKSFRDSIRTFAIFRASRTRRLTPYHDTLMSNPQTISKTFKSVQYPQWSSIRTSLNPSDPHIKTISCLDQSFGTQSDTELSGRLRRALSSLKVGYASLAMIANPGRPVIDLGGPHPCRVPGPPRHRHAQARPSCDWACLCLWSKSLGRAWACLQSLKLLLGVPVPCPVPGASGTGPPKEARLFLDIGSLLHTQSVLQ